ncbi:hypothetical protein KVC53_06760 [Helicobacter pylori]|nr:hypothetical protein KVC53_06760 [Helicobacter pylori]
MSSFFQKGVEMAFKHSSNQAIKQSSNATITFITFTKTDLKIPYSLLFPLLFLFSLTLSLTHTAIFLKNLIP